MSAKDHKWYQDIENKWVKSLPFVDTTAAQLLNWATQQNQDSEKEKAWVFDLDSTLFCLAPRIHNIFFEFVRAHPQPPSEWVKLVGLLDSAHQKYSIEETFKDLLQKIVSDPFVASQMASQLWNDFYPFWKEHFFEDRHIHHDIAYPGAADFVRSIKSLGKKVIYLTGRDRLGSSLGTRTHLLKSGFDMGMDEQLLMKPRRHDDDAEFKRSAIKLLRAQFNVECVLDNEPENLVMFAKELPHAKIVLFHSVMSGRIPKEDIVSYLGNRRLEKISSFLG